MGNRAAGYLRKMLADSGRPVRVAWFPGPEGATWVAAGDQGFREGIEGSIIEIVVSAKGDTGRATQGRLVGAALDAHPDLDYIVGTAVTAEAAVTQLSRRGLSDRVRVLAYYYSPGVHRGIRRGWIVAAPMDLQAIEARIANQLVLALEKRPFVRHVAPKVRIVDHTNITDFDSSGTLPPRGFRPIFSVNE
jgi:protein TorT